MKRRLRIVLAALGLTLVLTACTPAEMAQYLAITEPTRHVLNNEQLHRLRTCESGGNYGIVSASGRYRGAYQFSRATWDSVAGRHYPFLRGLDPAASPWYWQDAMARALFAEQGAAPWPHCGRRL
ncbi:MAG: transglycosylase family protein [Acidimicrobiia bacterium]|nr:transglycosylase family protein [Acidimicrobiia bacterium]MDH5236362.1 transglycosylase family protein [Acidimicrobiia bacterium]